MRWLASIGRRIRGNPTALAGTIVMGVLVVLIVVGPWLIPYSPTRMNYSNLLKPPSLAHPFGTDSFGRDVFVRVLYGARVSLFCSLTGILLAAVIGTLMGLLAGYFGRVYEATLMRVADLLFAFPSFVLALFLMFVFGFGVLNVVLAIGLVYLPGFARLARNMTLLVKEEAYVQAAKVSGQTPFRIMTREILPNIAPPLIVRLSLGFAFGVVIEAGLSFLGLGVQPPTPSLGLIMSDAKEYFQRAPWVLTLTGLGISVILLGLNLLGDGLRDMMDPRLRRREEA